MICDLIMFSIFSLWNHYVPQFTAIFCKERQTYMLEFYLPKYTGLGVKYSYNNAIDYYFDDNKTRFLLSSFTLTKFPPI